MNLSSLVLTAVGIFFGFTGSAYLFRIPLGHDLDLEFPLRRLAALDRAKERLLVALAAVADYFGGLGIGVECMALESLEMKLDPESLTPFVPQ